jgi:hypothetical protein
LRILGEITLSNILAISYSLLSRDYLAFASEGEEVPLILSAIEDQVDDMITEISPFAGPEVQYRHLMLSDAGGDPVALQHPDFEYKQHKSYLEANNWQQSPIELLATELGDDYIFPASRKYPAFIPLIEGV